MNDIVGYYYHKIFIGMSIILVGYMYKMYYVMCTTLIFNDLVCHDFFIVD